MQCHPECSDLYARAKRRVLSSPRLHWYASVIMGDGYASNEDHLRWVLRGTVEEIEGWAWQIVHDTDR